MPHKHKTPPDNVVALHPVPAEAKHIDVATAAATILNEHGVAIERGSGHGRAFLNFASAARAARARAALRAKCMFAIGVPVDAGMKTPPAAPAAAPRRRAPPPRPPPRPAAAPIAESPRRSVREAVRTTVQSVRRSNHVRIVLDTSGSMSQRDGGSETRWRPLRVGSARSWRT